MLSVTGVYIIIIVIIRAQVDYKTKLHNININSCSLWLVVMVVL